jgi:hypothetical protein
MNPIKQIEALKPVLESLEAVAAGKRLNRADLRAMLEWAGPIIRAKTQNSGYNVVIQHLVEDKLLISIDLERTDMKASKTSSEKGKPTALRASSSCWVEHPDPDRTSTELQIQVHLRDMSVPIEETRAFPVIGEPSKKEALRRIAEDAHR